MQPIRSVFKDVFWKVEAWKVGRNKQIQRKFCDFRGDIVIPPLSKVEGWDVFVP